jgi:predicted RNA binding protein YcfA (HicA-like mRNA interferase family)
MPPVPLVRGDRIVKALIRAGFYIDRTRGSHVILRRPDGRGTTVPVHGGRDVPRGTLRSILDELGLTVDELKDLL